MAKRKRCLPLPECGAPADVRHIGRCNIYFIQSGLDGPIKIGRTDWSPDRRLKDLQTAHYEELRIVGYQDNVPESREGKLHAKFRHIWIRGEWFRPESELIDYINTQSTQWNPGCRHTSHEYAPLIAQFKDGPDAEPREVGPDDLSDGFQFRRRERRPRRDDELLPLRRCQRCHDDFRTADGDRFCIRCRNALLALMMKDGYLRAL